MTRILIANSYSWYNKGDAAIVTAMIQVIREYIPYAEITLLSFTPEIDEKKYGVKVFSNLLNPYPYEKSLTYKIMTSFKLLKRSIHYILWSKSGMNNGFFLSTSEKKTLESYKTADIIMSVGGSYLGGYNYGILLHIYALYFGKLFNKPIFITGISVDPTKNRLILMLTKFILKKADLIAVREEISLKYLKLLIKNVNIFLTGDYAFLLKATPKKKSMEMLGKESIFRGKRPLVGITVRRWNFPGEKTQEIKYKNYVHSIKQAIGYLITDLNAFVIFFPQVIFQPKDDDRVISKQISETFGPEFLKYIKVLEKDYSPGELKGMIGEMDMFVGTRMHSNIFSLSQGVPTIGIGYEIKTRGIMKEMGMEEYVIDIEKISSKCLISKIEEVWNRRIEIHNDLNNKVKKMENCAWRNGKLIKERL